MFQIAWVGANSISRSQSGCRCFSCRGRFRAWAGSPVFHLPVVLEKGHVVGGGVDAKYLGRTRRNLHQGIAKAMLDACPLDPAVKLRAKLLRQLRGDLRPRKVAICSAFTLSTDCRVNCSYSGPSWRQNGNQSVAYSTCIRLQVGGPPEHRAPDSTSGIAVEHTVQQVGREPVRQFLGTVPVVDPRRRCQPCEANASRRQLLSQPAMAVAVELQAERRPGGNPEVDQAQVRSLK